MFSESYRASWIKRRVVIEILGGECQVCGFGDSRALQVTPAGTGTSYYNKILRDPLGYNLHCANCNQIKRASDVPKEMEERAKQKAATWKLLHGQPNR